MSRRPIVRALEEARYGPDGLLNLRDSMPTEAEAVARAESWLRERQVLGLDEVVIITGRGAGSPGGIPVVREGIRRVLASLRRRGVVDDFNENGPGSFVIRVAPLRRLFDAPRRRRDEQRARRAGVEPSAIAPAALDSLHAETLSALQRLARLSLATLGVKPSEKFVADEMLRQFSLLAAAIPDGPDREKLLREAAVRTIAEYEDSA